MPLPLTVSCFSKIHFLVLAYPGSPGKRAVKRVCVCVPPVVERDILQRSRVWQACAAAGHRFQPLLTADYNSQPPYQARLQDTGSCYVYWASLATSSLHQPTQQLQTHYRYCTPSMLWRCWLGGRKGIRPVKTEWSGTGMVICLERGADLHTAQLMPLPLTVSCFSKIQIGFTFLVPA